MGTTWDGVWEGRMVDMFYAAEGGPVISAEQFDSEILRTDDERLWDFLCIKHCAPAYPCPESS